MTKERYKELKAMFSATQSREALDDLVDSLTTQEYEEFMDLEEKDGKGQLSF